MMELYVLLLMLSLPAWSQADCSAQCLNCARHISELDSAVSRVTCSLECEGTVSSTGTLDRCEKILQQLSEELTELNLEADAERNGLNADDLREPAGSSLVKRYGGFIKRIDKNKNKIFASPWKENAVLKGLFAKHYGDSLSKVGERDVPSLTEDEEGEDVTAENETGLYDNDLPVNAVKRYGGFLRKFGPKRSDSTDDSNRPMLQKRYGGFMRRIRPKLRWDNQKRYGGFLRRHFKISVRSEEEPSSYEDYTL